MAKYKDNHIIPKALLNQWKVTGPHWDGTYCYEGSTNATTFYSAKGERGFSFAIGRYFYVPERSGARIVTVEHWLSGLEDVLGRVLPKMKTQTGNPFQGVEERTKFLMALMSLQYRTKYQLEAVARHLELHPNLRLHIQDQPSEVDHTVYLENMINAVTEGAIEAASWHLSVNWNASGNLLLSDEPFIAEMGDPLLVTCSPYFFIALTRSGFPGGISYRESDPAMVKSVNSLIAQKGRYWIVGREESNLIDYITEFNQPKQAAQATFQWLRHSPNGHVI
jgi:hypothetical protein